VHGHQADRVDCVNRRVRFVANRQPIEMFGDPVIAAAMLDRLLHHCRVINIKGNSYRMKGFKESNSVV